MNAYGLAIVGILLICLLPIALANVVGPFKGQQKLVGGPVGDARDENFLFRLDRTHANSVESIPAFVAPAILGVVLNVAPWILALFVWAFLVVRLLYSVVYLRGGPLAKGGSLRTVLHVLGSLTTIALMIVVAMAAF